MSNSSEKLAEDSRARPPFWRTGKFVLATVAASVAGASFGGVEYGSHLNHTEARDSARIAARHGRCLDLVKRNALPRSQTAVVHLASLSTEQLANCDLKEADYWNADPAIFPGLKNLTTLDQGHEYTLLQGNNGAGYSLEARVVKILPRGKILSFETPDAQAQQRAINHNRPLEMIAVRKAADAVIELPGTNDLENAIAKDEFVAKHGLQGNYSNELPFGITGGILGFVGSGVAWFLFAGYTNKKRLGNDRRRAQPTGIGT